MTWVMEIRSMLYICQLTRLMSDGDVAVADVYGLARCLDSHLA